MDTRAFLFTQTGKTSLLYNSFKVQYISTTLFEGQEVLVPFTGFIGTDVYSSGYFWNPEDIALDRQGFIFVVDAGAAAVSSDSMLYNPGFFRFSSSGTLLQSVVGFGSEPKKFNSPKGIAVSPFLDDQLVYVADTGNNRIMIFKLSTD